MLDVTELRTLFLFADLTDEQVTWIAERGEMRTYGTGAAVYTEGEPAECLFVLVEGRVRLSRLSAGEDVVLNETGHRGVYSGAVRAFVEDADAKYTNSMVAVEPSRLMRLSAVHFADFMKCEFPMAVHLLDGLYVGVRTSEATLRQREHLAGLGRLSANLAHELNNPAAAAVRATGQLRQRVAGMRHKLGMIAEGGLDRTQIQALVRLQEAAVERAAKPRDPLGPVQTSDREDALADLLDDHGVAGSYDLAPVLVAAGLDEQWVRDVAQETGDTLDSALRWLSYTLETEALMDEIEDATGRISTLVASVKQYSSMDTASVQEVDLHAGLDSTVVMLGHKLAGVEVVRDYDRTLPKVPVRPAELNQVWTNLIDNATDAMGGHGRLVLRTSRSGDDAVVEVSDDGPGVPAELQERVFEAFFTTKPPGEGSGLGLDNAHRIVVKRHHGTISLASEPGATTFAVRLPLRQGLA